MQNSNEGIGRKTWGVNDDSLPGDQPTNMEPLMFETSESTAKLDAALAKAQGEIEHAVKDKTNPAYKSKYADLTSVWGACRDALARNAISVTQWPLHSLDGRLHILTRVAHAGEWVRCRFSIPVQRQDAHGYASGTTYAKRIALAAAIGVVADEDDDGNAANAASAAAPSRPAPPPKQAAPEPAKADDRAAQWVAKMRKQIAACSSVDELGGLDAAAAPAMNKLAATHPDDHKALRDLFTARAETLSKELAHV